MTKCQGYFTLAPKFATRSFVYVAYLHDLSFLQLVIFWRLCSLCPQQALRQPWGGGGRLLCSEGFCVGSEKAPPLCVCLTQESTKWTRKKLIKIHGFTDQFITPPPPSLHPLGKEVVVACDKKKKKGSLVYQSPFFYLSCILKIPKSAWIFHFREKTCP